MIRWSDLTREEFDVAEEIATRAVDLYKRSADGRAIKKMEFVMDVCACHLKCPLDLFRLLASDDENFAHDIFGIRRHINRETGELNDCFLPRFAKQEGSNENA